MHEQIIKARQELGLSQSAFAKLTGIERSQIRRLEEGRSVTTTTLARVLKHLPNLRVLHFQGVEIVQTTDPAEVRQVLTQLATAAQEVADSARRLLALVGRPTPAAAAEGDEAEAGLAEEIRELDEEVEAIRRPGRAH